MDVHAYMHACRHAGEESVSAKHQSIKHQRKLNGWEGDGKGMGEGYVRFKAHTETNKLFARGVVVP